MPIPVLGKKPVPAGATGYTGNVTEEKIAAWCADPMWADGNVALRAEGYIAIDVDAYGDKHGDRTIADLEAQLGELPVTITSTSRGADSPSRQHFYRVPEGLTFLSALDDVEIIQRSHRYSVVYPSIHPDTGAQYTWYGYEGEALEDLPAIDDLEDLPQAWLEFLVKPHVSTPESAGFGGTVDEWLSKCDQGEPSEFILEWVDSIPKTDFGHDEMVQMQAALVGLGASGKPGVPWALDRLRAEWLREPYNTPVYRRDWQMALEGAIQKYGNFEADVLAELLAPTQVKPAVVRDYLEAAMSIGGPEFFTAWTTLPEVVTPESRAERVRRVLYLALESGSVNRLEAVEIALNAAANKDEQRDMILTREGVEALAADTFPGERLYALEEEQEPVAPVEPAKTVHLLKPTEEMALENRAPWWGDEFMDRMAEINPIMSEQFYRLDRWIILSLVFAHRAVIPAENGTNVLLNFYSIRLGPSGIGKSESLNPVRDMMKAFYLPEDTPDIGGNATEAGLLRALHARDGKTSFFHSDEADGVLLAWGDKLSAFAGMKQRVTDVYTGTVGPSLRSTAPELNKHSTAYMCADLTGIDERILDAIEPHDWETGFINRFIWVKGHRKSKTREQKRFNLRRSTKLGGKGSADWYTQWAADFRRIESTTLASPDGKPVWMDFDDAVLDRHIDAHDRLEAVAQNSAYPERLRPTFTRMEVTILKCAALVAITRRRRRVEMEDYLIALEQAEEWLENVMEMVERTDESPRARQVNRLADLIASQGGVMRRADIHARKGYAGQARDTNALIDELIAQGRAELLPAAKESGFVHLIGKEG